MTMNPCIMSSGDSLLHLRPRIMLSTLPPVLRPRLVVDVHVCVPAAAHRHHSCTFSFCSMPTTMPYHDWRRNVEQMILTAAGHDALALHLGDLVFNFCTYTHSAFARFRASPAHFLFLSAVIEVAPNHLPRHFYYFPSPGAEMKVQEGVVSPVTPAGYRFDGGTPASALPTRSTIKGLNAAAEGDRESSCAICLEEYEAGEVLDELLCRHRFHPCCLVEWLRKRSTCPLCRMPVPFDPQ